MTLRMNGSTSGFVELDCQATGGNNNIKLPSSNGSANQFLKNGSTAGTLGWSSLVEDSSGRVLIGTSSGSIDFQVKTSGGLQVVNSNEIALRYNVYYDGVDRYIQAANKASSLVMNGNGDFVFYSTNTASTSAGSTISGWTARAQIEGNGRYTVTSSVTDDFGFRIITNTGNQYNLGLYKSTDQATVNEDYIRGTGGSTTRFKFVGNGGLYNYSANNSNLSDEREKKNIETLDSTWDCLKHWELKKFHYNEDPDGADKRYGVIAQQVGEYCPEVLTDWIKQEAAPAKLDDNGNEIEPAREEIARIGVKEQQMMWMAVKALQEAQVRIETLEASNAALEARLTALEAQS